MVVRLRPFVKNTSGAFYAFVVLILILAMAGFLYLVFAEILEPFFNYAESSPHVGYGTWLYALLYGVWGHGWILLVILLVAVFCFLMYLHMSNYEMLMLNQQRRR